MNTVKTNNYFDNVKQYPMPSTSNSVNFNQLVCEIVDVAHAAGNIVMKIYRSADLSQTRKADDSPLTAADTASHQFIEAALTKLTPAIPLLSEEAADIPYDERAQWPCFWMVDPLDGTKEFIKRNGEFTINIALIENGIPVLGVVYAPVLDVCYYGQRGVGAFVRRGQSVAHPIRIKQHMIGETIKVVASRSHSNERTQALLDKLENYECISMGSSLKLCLVAEGAAHFYPRLGPTMEWDTAAAHAVVNAAGGGAYDKAGNELCYNKSDLHNQEFFVYARSDNQLHQLVKAFNE